jgi:hypothetical protein
MPATAQGFSACTDPAFVLCTSRSGSTLLRFVLDAHPDLACPPELKMPNVLAQLARLWSATDALASTSAENGSGPAVSPAAAAGIRHTMDLMIGPYLAQRGKKRYCDKNLGTEPHVETLLAVYPEAKFICLYRHPMDMIASGVEACPWGLNHYGFEPYVANAPGNTVLALARYWTDHVGAILAVEDRFPDKCHRVRYEDLVADPEATAAGIFEFLGLPSVPGISAFAFSRERERTGPGDFKIWNTSEITDDSVGRGWSVPADLIPAPLTATINTLADRLSYVPIDTNWGTIRKPSDLRLPAEGQAPILKSARPGTRTVPPGSQLVNERLQAGLRRLSDEFIQEWKPHSDESFLLVALAPTSTDDDAWWLINLTDRRVMTGNGTCAEDRGWTISAPDATWDQAIRQGLNLGIAFRRHGMRYRDKGGGGAGSTTADTRVSMMSDLLGITTWNPSSTGGPSPAPSVSPAPALPVSPAPAAPPVSPAPPVSLVPSPANLHQVAGPPTAGERPADEELGDHAADDELPAWEHDRQPPPQGAILDADVWQAAPAGKAPKPARVSVRTTPPTASITPGPTQAQRPSAGRADLGASAPARKQPQVPSYSRRTPGKPRHPTGSARERLRLERLQRERRRRRFRIAAVAGVALIAASIITSLSLENGGGASPKVATVKPGFGYPGPYAPVTLNADNSVTMAQPGVTQPILNVYEDFLCSACRTFEKGSGAAIQRLADEGKVKVVYYPFTAFGSQPQQANSIRAWAAAKCAPANLWARYHNSLYASQPAQTAASGFAVNLLVRLGRNAGITSSSFAQCVESQQYALEDLPLSDQIINSGVSNMLTVTLNGKALNPDLTSSELRQQIISASSGRTTA